MADNVISPESRAAKHERWRNDNLFRTNLFSQEKITLEDLIHDLSWLRSMALIYQMTGSQDIETLDAGKISQLTQGTIPATMTRGEAESLSIWGANWVSDRKEDIKDDIKDVLPDGATQEQEQAVTFAADTLSEMPGDAARSMFWERAGYDHTIFAIEDYKEDALEANESFLKASAVVYLMEKENELEDDLSDSQIRAASRGDFSALNTEQRKMLGEWGTSHMSWFNSNIANMAQNTAQITGATQEQKLAFLYMLEAYDHKDMSWGGFFRGLGGVAADPTTYLGIGTLGAGLLVRQGGKEAGKLALKEGLRHSVKAMVMQGAKIGAVEGAVYGFADDAMRQRVAITADRQQGFSWGQSATSTATGTLVGSSLGGGIAGVASDPARGWISRQFSRVTGWFRGTPTPPVPTTVIPEVPGMVPQMAQQAQGRPPVDPAAAQRQAEQQAEQARRQAGGRSEPFIDPNTRVDADAPRPDGRIDPTMEPGAAARRTPLRPQDDVIDVVAHEIPDSAAARTGIGSHVITAADIDVEARRLSAILGTEFKHNQVVRQAQYALELRGEHGITHADIQARIAKNKAAWGETPPIHSEERGALRMLAAEARFKNGGNVPGGDLPPPTADEIRAEVTRVTRMTGFPPTEQTVQNATEDLMLMRAYGITREQISARTHALSNLNDEHIAVQELAYEAQQRVSGPAKVTSATGAANNGNTAPAGSNAAQGNANSGNNAPGNNAAAGGGNNGAGGNGPGGSGPNGPNGNGSNGGAAGGNGANGSGGPISGGGYTGNWGRRTVIGLSGDGGLADETLTILPAPKETIFNTGLRYHFARVANLTGLFDYKPHKFVPNFMSEDKYIKPILDASDRALADAGIVNPAKAMHGRLLVIAEQLRNRQIGVADAKVLLAEQFADFGTNNAQALQSMRDNLRVVLKELDIYEAKYGPDAKSRLVAAAEANKKGSGDGIDIGPLAQKYSGYQGLDSKQLTSLREDLTDLDKIAADFLDASNPTSERFTQLIDRLTAEGQNPVNVAKALQVALDRRFSMIGSDVEMRVAFNSPDESIRTAARKNYKTEDVYARQRGHYMGYYNTNDRLQAIIPPAGQNVENRLLTALSEFKGKMDAKGLVKNDVESANSFFNLVTAMYDTGYEADAARLIRGLQLQRGRTSVETFPDGLKSRIEQAMGQTKDQHKIDWYKNLVLAVTDIKDDNFYLGARDVEKRYFSWWMNEWFVAKLYPGISPISTPTTNKYIREPLANNGKRALAFLLGGETAPPDAGKGETTRSIKYNWWFQPKDEKGNWWNNNLYARAPSWFKMPVRILTLPIQAGWHASAAIVGSRTFRETAGAVGLTGLLLTGAEEIGENFLPADTWMTDSNGNIVVFGHHLDAGSRMMGGVLMATNAATAPIRWGVEVENSIIKSATGYGPLKYVPAVLDLDNSLVPWNARFLGDRGAGQTAAPPPAQPGATNPPPADPNAPANPNGQQPPANQPPANQPPAQTQPGQQSPPNLNQAPMSTTPPAPGAAAAQGNQGNVGAIFNWFGNTFAIDEFKGDGKAGAAVSAFGSAAASSGKGIFNAASNFIQRLAKKDGYADDWGPLALKLGGGLAAMWMAMSYISPKIANLPWIVRWPVKIALMVGLVMMGSKGVEFFINRGNSTGTTAAVQPTAPAQPAPAQTAPAAAPATTPPAAPPASGESPAGQPIVRLDGQNIPYRQGNRPIICSNGSVINSPCVPETATYTVNGVPVENFTDPERALAFAVERDTLFTNPTDMTAQLDKNGNLNASYDYGHSLQGSNGYKPAAFASATGIYIETGNSNRRHNPVRAPGFESYSADYGLETVAHTSPEVFIGGGRGGGRSLGIRQAEIAFEHQPTPGMNA